MKQPCYILGFTASPRRNGNTELLMNKIIEGAKSRGAITEVIHLRSLQLKQCIACERCRTFRVCRAHHDDMQLLYPKIKAAQGLILGSPVHSFNISAKMKIFLDRLYPFYHFALENRQEWSSLLPKGKKALIFTVGEQLEGMGAKLSLKALGTPLEILGCEISHQFNAQGFFEKGAVLKNEEILQHAYQSGVDLVEKLTKDKSPTT